MNYSVFDHVCWRMFQILELFETFD
jgi:hypothetical protein